MRVIQRIAVAIESRVELTGNSDLASADAMGCAFMQIESGLRRLNQSEVVTGSYVRDIVPFVLFVGMN
jgi:hypothetical protein